MKKIILSLIIITGLVLSFNDVIAKSATFSKIQMNAVKKLLRKYGVEAEKIKMVENILNNKPANPVQYQMLEKSKWRHCIQTPVKTILCPKDE